MSPGQTRTSRTGWGTRCAPLPRPSRAPQPCARACVSPRRPLPRALRLRLLRRTRAASLRAARGGGHGRRAPNLSDPRSRPGAAGAAGERSAPLSRGSGPSCATRPDQAGRGRGDERRPRGSAPGWGGTRGSAIENWRSGEVGAASRPPAPSRSAPRPHGLCDGRIQRVEASEISAEER